MLPGREAASPGLSGLAETDSAALCSVGGLQGLSPRGPALGAGGPHQKEPQNPREAVSLGLFGLAELQLLLTERKACWAARPLGPGKHVFCGSWVSLELSAELPGRETLELGKTCFPRLLVRHLVVVKPVDLQ